MSERAVATFDLPQGAAGSLRCSACVNRACDAIETLPGVERIECDRAGASARVTFDPGRVSESDLIAEMDRFGLELAATLRHAAWRVTGLD